MRRSGAIIKAGWQKYEERRQLRFDAEVSKQIELARKPWGEAIAVLRKYKYGGVGTTVSGIAPTRRC